MSGWIYSLRCRPHFHRNPGLGTESDEVVERQLVHFVSRDFGDSWLGHAQTLGSLRLGDPFSIDPFAQSFRKFASQQHDGRFMRLKTEIGKDVTAAFRAGLTRRFLHDLTPINRYRRNPPSRLGEGRKILTSRPDKAHGLQRLIIIRVFVLNET